MAAAAYKSLVEDLDLPDLLNEAEYVRDATETRGWKLVQASIDAHAARLTARLVHASTKPEAIDYLRGGGASLTANCGYGHGYSVREVLQSVEKVAGTKLVLREEPRRAGDPPSLVARCDIVRNALGWTPKLDDIDTIVRTSLEWERRLQREPW